MDLNLIDVAPVLDYDYPLFSWNDWPKSRDSLEPMIPVEQFEAACWNDMVSKLHDLLLALQSDGWANAPYFYDGKKNYFTASMYNEMFDSMRRIFPLYNYMDWLKYYAHKGDSLTPGHLMYIAQYLNLVLGVGRGSIELVQENVYHNSVVTSDMYIDVLKSVPVATSNFADNQCRTTSSIWLDQLLSVPVHTSQILHSILGVDAKSPWAVKTKVEHLTKTNRSVTANRRTAAPVSEAAAVIRSISSVSVLSAAKKELTVEAFSRTILNASAVVAEPVPSSVQYMGRGYFQAELQAPSQLPMRASAASGTKTASALSVAEQCPMELIPLSGSSCVDAAVDLTGAVAAGYIRHGARSKLLAEFFSRNAERIFTGIIGGSAVLSSVNVPFAVQTEAQLGGYTKHQANAITRTARPAWADGITETVTSAKAVVRNAENGAADQSSATEAVCAMDTLESANVQAGTLGISQTSCQAAIWLLPLQPDSKTLFIRQTYKEAIKIGDTLYVDEWPDQGRTDDGTLFLWRLYDTVLQVGNTLYIGSMPNTGKTDGETLLIWDVEQEPVQTLNLLEVF